MYKKTESVKPLPDRKLLVTYAGGEQRIFDVAPYLMKGIFAELRDEAVFRSVHVSFDTVQWGNGADICPETLYDDSVPVLSKVAEQKSAYGKG